MVLGKIFGKVNTTHFTLKVEVETKKFEYIKVTHKDYGDVLCQIIEIEKSDDGEIAKCIVIGYKDDENVIKPLRIPFEPHTEVSKADDEFIKKIIRLEDAEKGAFIGRLDGKEIDVKLDLSKLLTKHVCVLAKTGAGKSYTVGVLLEEIIVKKVPLLIIDPHGEYSSLKNPNTKEKDRLGEWSLKPKGFKNIKEYGDQRLNKELIPLKINDNLTPAELVHLIPGKLSANQMGMLHNVLKHIDKISFANILKGLELEENNSKWSLVNNLEYLNSLNLFSEIYTEYSEIVKSGQCSIINLKGIPPEVQEIIVYKLLEDLFTMRKNDKIPPFFCVIEECHNYCPERSFGETKCSKTIRTIASEGRKFGLGLCVVSQRPARVDKSVLSQCNTQIILKITNPNDLKAISSSIEGITSETESELQNLPIGSALVTGITELPLFVNIRPRMTKHGGETVEIIKKDDIFDKLDEFKDQEIMALIRPKITMTDIKNSSAKKIIRIDANIAPSYLVTCVEKDKRFNILIEAEKGEIVIDIENYKTKKIPELKKLSKEEIVALMNAYNNKTVKKDLIVEGLEKKGLIKAKDSENYELNEEYLFTKITNAATNAEIIYESFDYKKIHPKKIKPEAIKKIIEPLAKVEDTRECYIIRYEIMYE